MEGVIERLELEPRDGFALAGVIVYDQDTRPTDYECYSAEQVQAWRNDEWCYVGVVVTASREGVELGESSLWGVDYGLGGEYGYARQVVAGQVADEAVGEAQRKLAALCGGAS